MQYREGGDIGLFINKGKRAQPRKTMRLAMDAALWEVSLKEMSSSLIFEGRINGYRNFHLVHNTKTQGTLPFWYNHISPQSLIKTFFFIRWLYILVTSIDFYQVECPNVLTINSNKQKGKLCVSSLGIYINLSVIVLSLNAMTW